MTMSMEYLKLPTVSPGINSVYSVWCTNSHGRVSFDFNDDVDTTSYGIPPNSGSLKEYDEICMNPDGFVIYCNITLSYGINRQNK